MTTPLTAQAKWLADLFGAASTSAEAWPAAMQAVATLQQDYFQQIAAWWMPGMATGTGLATAGAPDKRFAGEAWQRDPRFEMAKQGYLAY